MSENPSLIELHGHKFGIGNPYFDERMSAEPTTREKEQVLTVTASDLRSLRDSAIPPDIQQTIQTVKDRYAYREYSIDGRRFQYTGLEAAWNQQTGQISNITLHLQHGTEKYMLRVASIDSGPYTLQLQSKSIVSFKEVEDRTKPIELLTPRGAIGVPRKPRTRPKTRTSTHEKGEKKKGAPKDTPPPESGTAGVDTTPLSTWLDTIGKNHGITQNTDTKSSGDFPLLWKNMPLQLQQASVIIALEGSKYDFGDVLQGDLQIVPDSQYSSLRVGIRKGNRWVQVLVSPGGQATLSRSDNSLRGLVTSKTTPTKEEAAFIEKIHTLMKSPLYSGQ